MYVGWERGIATRGEGDTFIHAHMHPSTHPIYRYTHISQETARQLGMGTSIRDSALLPKVDENRKPPEDLMDHFEYIEGTNGFAQVYPVGR